MMAISMAAALAATIGLTGPAVAGADDYVFEPVKTEIKPSNVAIVAVRLLHKATRQPVAGAAIVQTRIEMAHDNMTMSAPLLREPSREPGVIAFKSPLTMAGQWSLSISAKVPGEPEPVVGRITFRVVQ